MKLGINQSAYYGANRDVEGLKRMKRHGYDCIDYNYLSNTDTHPAYAWDEADFVKNLTEIRNEINAEGIEIAQTHGPWRWPPRDFEEADRAERFEKMTKCIRATKILGSKYMVIHPFMPFGWDQNPDPEYFWEMNREFLLKLTKVGEDNGVIVCLENMPMPALTIASPANTLKMVKEIDSPWLRVCLDTGHCSYDWAEKPGEAVRLIGKEYLATLHVHDNNGQRDLHWNPYTGVIDWKDFSSALNEIGFDGVMSLETDLSHSMHVPADIREYFEIGLAKIGRKLMEDPRK